MKNQNLNKKIYSLLKPEKSKWIKEAEERQQSNSWRKRSQKIALYVLRTLRTKSITQKTFAEMMDVSPQMVNKWLKGGENLTLESISKMENALSLELISVNIGNSKLESKVIKLFAIEKKWTIKSKVESIEYVESEFNYSKIVPFKPINSYNDRIKYAYN